MALGSRLRVLSENFTENAKSVYELYDIPLKPKWFPVFYILSNKEDMSIMNIANDIGHSHPSVVKIVKEMRIAGIVASGKDKKDARKTNVFLTPKGRLIAEKIEAQYQDVNAAVEEILNNQTYNIWKALDELEFMLSEKSLFRRVLEQKKQREAKLIEIVDYSPSPEHKKAFKELNQEWIEEYFTMEEADYKSLDNPEKYVLKNGGAILFALYESEIAGVCALMKSSLEKYDYELAKMAVSPKFHGKGIGYALGNAIVERAKKLKAETIYLESNTILSPAINLYRKLGFKKIQGLKTPYERSNIQMELHLM